MKDNLRRRGLWLSVGALYLVLISYNVVRAVNGRPIGASAAGAVATATTRPPLVAQQPPVPTTAEPKAAPASGTPVVRTIPSSAPTSEFSSNPQTSASDPSPLPAASPVSGAAAAVSASAAPVQRLSPTPASRTAPNGFSTIQGNALRATGVGLPNVTVRLRDARFGRIVDKQTSNESGLFAFRSIDPGVYLVELVGNDGSVLAASQVLNVTAGETASAAVRLPFRSQPLGGVLGDSVPTAAIVAAEAAAAGVLTTTITEPLSPTH